MANTGTASQDANQEHLSEGQGTSGAPSAPAVNNTAPEKPVPANTEADATSTIEVTTNQPATTATQPAATQDQWPTFQDQALTASSNLMKDAGLALADMKAIFAKTIATGNLADVDLPTLEAKIGKDKAALAMIGVKDYFTRQQEITQKTIQEVEGIFGGKEAYAKVRDWATAKASTDSNFAKDVDKYREMFNAGGVSARAAALDLLSVYTKSPDTSGLNNKVTQGDKVVTVDTASQKPLSRSEYLPLLKEANKKGDRRLIAELDARRRAGIKAKI